MDLEAIKGVGYGKVNSCLSLFELEGVLDMRHSVLKLKRSQANWGKLVTYVWVFE